MEKVAIAIEAGDLRPVNTKNARLESKRKILDCKIV